MKKRIVSALICGTIVAMSVSGCASTTDTVQNETAVEQISVEKKESDSSTLSSVTDQQDSSDSSKESATELAMVTADLPTYLIAEKNFFEIYDGDKTFSDSELDYSEGVLFTGNKKAFLMSDEYADKYPELYKTLKSEADNIINGDDFKETIKFAKYAYEEAVDGKYGFYGPYSSTSDYIVMRNDEIVLSVNCSYYDYEGGAHGMYGVSCNNYDVQTGEKLGLSEVILVTEEEFKQMIITKLNEIAEDPDQFWDLEETLSHYKYEPKEYDPDDIENYEIGYNWYFGADGFHILFNPYDIAAYAYGSTDILFSYDECDGLINEKYILSGNQEYITTANIPLINSEYEGDYGNIYLKYTPEADYPEYGTELSIVVNGNEAAFKDSYIDTSSDGIKKYEIGTSDGKKYIYVTVPDANDYYALYIFDISNDEPKTVAQQYYHDFYAEMDNGYYAESALTNIHNLRLGQVFDIMGTFTAYGTYEVGEDGAPKLKEDNYIIQWVSDEIYSKEEVQGVIVDEAGTVVDDDEVIGVGVHFAPYRTNGSTYIDCKLDDGRIIRLNFTTADYEYFINDINVNDLFDGLTYAG